MPRHGRAAGRRVVGVAQRPCGPHGRRRMIAVRAGALCSALVVSLGSSRAPAAPPKPRATQAAKAGIPRILVVTFETPRDPRTYWLGEAAAVVMTDDLNARGLRPITRAAPERADEPPHPPAPPPPPP